MSNSFKPGQFEKSRGFTILEIMVAIFVINIGVIAALSAVLRATTVTFVSSSKLTAAYLVQEGIEIIRNIRDTNRLEGAAWNDGIPEADCLEADYESKTLSLCGPELRYLYIDVLADGSRGFYKYIDSPFPEDIKTKFKRKITVVSDGPDILKISVLVEWQERGKDFQATVQENLYNY